MMEASRRLLTLQRHLSSNAAAAAAAIKHPCVNMKAAGSLKGKTIFVTGASRGIGLAIAKRAAVDGANIVIAAKTAEPHPKLAGTIFTAAKEIELLGGQALPLVCDIRFEEQVDAAVERAVATFGGIDILVNNASAISLTSTEKTSMKRFDLMHQVNTRGTFMVSQKCLPFLRQAENPHILNLSPPLNMLTKWFENHVAYTMAKYGMSMCVLGMAGEFKKDGIAVNALWPATTISTAAVQALGGGDKDSQMMKRSRTSDIMADAAMEIFTAKSTDCSGNFFVDQDVLASIGVTDFTKYKNDPSVPDEKLYPDFFL